MRISATGTFRDASSEAGVWSVDPAFGLGTVILDFDDDGFQDVFVGNDSMPNYLFLGRAGLRFEERGMRGGLATNLYGSPQSTMGIAVGDVDDNGLADLFTTNFSNDSNTLHLNMGRGMFDDKTARYGLGMAAYPYVGWACGFYDFDHDGDEDLLAFNGHVYPNATRELMDADFLEPPLLYARDGNLFQSVSAATAGSWLDQPHCDRGAAFGDLDNDGDIDVVVLELQGAPRLLRNDGASASWLIVECKPALGARVEVEGNGKRQTRWIHSGGSFASASAGYAHFGLGDDVDAVRLEIRWPNGERHVSSNVDVNQHVLIERAP